MKYFLKIEHDQYDEDMGWLLSHPLHLSVLILCAQRARKSPSIDKNTGLDQWEFYLSQLEYDKFGLKPTQKGRLERVLRDLCAKSYLRRHPQKTGSKGGAVYIYNKDNPVTYGSEAGSKQVANRYERRVEEIKSVVTSAKPIVDNSDKKESIPKQVGDILNIYTIKELHKAISAPNWARQAARYIALLKISQEDHSLIFAYFFRNTALMESICTYILESKTEIRNHIGYILSEYKRRTTKP